MSEWISVKDRLPEKTDHAQKVLFVTKTGGFFIGCYYKAAAYEQFTGWYSMEPTLKMHRMAQQTVRKELLFSKRSVKA